MAVFDQLYGALGDLSRGSLALVSASLIVLVLLGRYLLACLQNPLNKIPGPFISKWTNWQLKLAIISGRRMYYVHDLHEKYGPYVRISPTEVCISDPEAFSQIHKIGSGFTKTKWYHELTAFERPTLFTMTDVKAHGARRKLMARAFSKTYLRQHWEGVVRDKIRLCVSKMIEESQREGKTDALKWWTFMATDVSTHLMFGDSFQMIEEGKKNEYIHVLETVLQGGGIGAELPLVRAVGRHLPFQPFKNLFAGNSFIMKKAEVAVVNAKALGGERNLFSHILHEAEKGEQLDDTDVKLEATALIVAGSDTTAVTTTYLIWNVLSHPALADLLREELAKLSDDYSDRELEELPVLNSVIEETLRLYGAAPGGIPRTMPSEGVFLGGYFFPAGTTVTTQAYTSHRNAYVFPQPYEFDHTRWLPESSTQAASPRITPDPELAKAMYSPFGAGARTCIGLHLARMELRLAAAEFFRRCKSAKLAPSTTLESMEMENFFLIAPKTHKCEVIC